MNPRDFLRAVAATRPALTSTAHERFAAPGTKALPHQIQREPVALNGRQRTPVARNTEDFKRISALPTRPALALSSPEAHALAREVTAELAVEPPGGRCDCRSVLGRPCVKHLRPEQAWALREMAQSEGLVGHLAVGSGKTALDILAPLAIPNVKVAALLVPPNLQDQLAREYDAVSRHFRVPNLNVHGSIRGKLRLGVPVLHVVPYSKFSRAESSTYLESLRPDLIIADEAQKLRNLRTATGGRVARYMAAHPETRVCACSGTLTGKSLRDYAHVSCWALKFGSPVPIDPNIVEEWALAIDPLEWNAPAGALYDFCEPGEHVRAGFKRRLLGTAGVVATQESAAGMRLVIDERKAPPVPEPVKKALNEVRRTFVRPDGEELVEKMQVVECARQLSLGFYYHWRFPRETPEALIYEWLDKRKAWGRELRRKLEDRAEHLDSALLCANAAARAYAPEPYKGELPIWKSETWPAWNEIKQKVRYYSEPVWVDDWLARDAAEWAKKHKGLVWCADRAFGVKVAKLAGLPYYAAQSEGGPKIVEKMADGTFRWNEDGKRSVVLSLDSYGTGTDGLQHRFAHQLVSVFPAGDLREQFLGRLHRPGQEADEVVTEVYRHTAELADPIDTAIRRAKYADETAGTQQKLNIADITFEVNAD